MNSWCEVVHSPGTFRELTRFAILLSLSCPDHVKDLVVWAGVGESAAIRNIFPSAAVLLQSGALEKRASLWAGG